jgi:hypothetical protein
MGSPWRPQYNFNEQHSWLVDAESRHLFATRPAAIIRIYFDPIRARGNLLAHRSHFKLDCLHALLC